MAIKIILFLTFLSLAALYTVYKVGYNQAKEEVEETTCQDFEVCNNLCYQCKISQKCWELSNHMY